MHECDTCGRKFDSPQALGAHIGLSHSGNPKVECNNCGNTFAKVRSKVEKHEKHFCSEDCRKTWLREEHNGSGKESPSWSGGKVETECSACGTTIYRFESEIFEDNVCSDICFKKVHSEKISGESNPNWKDGERPEYGYAWEQIREQAIQRDSENCQICGKSREESKKENSRDLSVHHIEPLREFNEIENAHDMENLITVCVECHPKVEAGISQFM